MLFFAFMVIRPFLDFLSREKSNSVHLPIKIEENNIIHRKNQVWARQLILTILPRGTSHGVFFNGETFKRTK